MAAGRKQKKKQLKTLQDWYSMFQKPRLKLRLPHQKLSLNKTVLVIPKFMTIFLMMTMGRMKREGATFCKGCDIEFEGYSNFINHLKVGTPCQSHTKQSGHHRGGHARVSLFVLFLLWDDSVSIYLVLWKNAIFLRAKLQPVAGSEREANSSRQKDIR